MISTVMRDRNFIICGTTGEIAFSFRMKGDTLFYTEQRLKTF